MFSEVWSYPNPQYWPKLKNSLALRIIIQGAFGSQNVSFNTHTKNVFHT